QNRFDKSSRGIFVIGIGIDPACTILGFAECFEHVSLYAFSEPLQTLSGIGIIGPGANQCLVEQVFVIWLRSGSIRQHGASVIIETAPAPHGIFPDLWHLR